MAIAKARCAAGGMVAQWVQRFITFFLALICAAAVAVYGYPAFSRWAYPPDRYYELADVVVVEAALLEDYLVRTTRSIKREFDGSYETTIRRVGESRPVCVGTKSLRYAPRQDGQMTTAEFTLEDWTASDTGRPCLDAIKADVLKRGPATFGMTSCIRIHEGLVVHMPAVCALTVFAYPSVRERPA